MQCQMVTDFVTGEEKPNVGAEENRQFVEKYLIGACGFSREEILVDFPLTLMIGDAAYNTEIDLVICVEDAPLMLIKCAAASLGSREREAVAGARVVHPAYQLPFAVVSDGKTALIYDALTGRQVGEGLGAIPNRDALVSWKGEHSLTPIPADRVQRQYLVFRTYDTMNVNVQRNT